ncbi:MAG TPA: hypothetical protein VGT03_14160 [Candidatus Acidoferrales bacterium]|nr:hypothetical protein [Candidatus Acidoferrales bacterium]
MRVRAYTDADLGALVAMHRAQGFEYPFPDVNDPIFVSKLVVEEENENGEGNRGGRIVMASLARLTCEMYLLADPHAGTPGERYLRLLELHRAGASDLRARGLDDAHAWLPPRIAQRFGRRLESLGWIRDDAWTPYCRRLR